MKNACFLILAGLLLLESCVPHPESAAKHAPVRELRLSASTSSDRDLQARWLIAELISPGGDAALARKARRTLGERAGGLLAHLARALDDSAHGRLDSVSAHYLALVQAARTSQDPHAPMLAWFAAHQALLYRRSDPRLLERWAPMLEASTRQPGAIGWRARAELVDLWQEGSRLRGERAEEGDLQELGAKLHGCLQEVRLAGPFGRQAPNDVTRSFPAEDPGPWPTRFPTDPGVRIPAEVLETEREGCHVRAKDPQDPGVFYAETRVELASTTDVLLAVQGAYAIWINDRPVLRRDPREWGSWPRFGVKVRLPAGRHRVLARIGAPVTSVRLLHIDGRPLQAKTGVDAALPYSLAAPLVLPRANVLDPYLQPGGRFQDPESDLLRFVAAVLAQVESQSDVANAFMEPLLHEPELATGLVLAQSALFTAGDPVFSESQRRDLTRELRERAVRKDPALWHPRLALGLLEGQRKGLPEAARAVRGLVSQFPQVPSIQNELLQLYSELGWKAEYARTALRLAESFPEDPDALEPAIEVLDAEGRGAEADRLVERIQRLDPDREVRLTRALDRRNYDQALRELERIKKRRPQRKDIAQRIHDVMLRAGNHEGSWKKLEAALREDPKSERARLDFADAEMAAGKSNALIRALLDATAEGGPTGRLEEALDLVEGVSELEPYRKDALSVIREYQESGRELAGTAARVLDYAVIWVHGDGSSRMLDHQLIRLQSAEAVTEMAEQPIGDGLLLRMRVIKKDGRILEPELVEAKPTLTMPHLEVGDYLETERISTMAGDGRRGARYLSPRWFFREENIAYAHSEFVVIAPESQPLQIETRNGVPEPEVLKDGAIVVRRWRVDHSPAAPMEPFSAPPVEFLPSVQLGWGVRLQQTLDGLLESATDMAPIDPRVVRIAKRIVDGVPGGDHGEIARRLYRWIVSQVEEGQEDDGRRVIIGRNGNWWRGYLMLCRALGLSVDYAVAQSRLSLPPEGPFSEVSRYSVPLLRVQTGQGERWLTFGSKFTPFGYVPAEARGMPAYALSPSQGPIATRVAEDGVLDRVSYQGEVRLGRDGAARVELVQALYGKYATALRDAFSELSPGQIRDLVETRLLGQTLRGARLLKHKIEHLEDPDRALLIRTTSLVPSFAEVSGGALLVSPPFAPRIGQLATLPERQTPLLLVDFPDQVVQLRLHLPKGTRAPKLDSREITSGNRRVTVRDRIEAGQVLLDRQVVIPAGRIQVADYPEFSRFARSADEALSASIRMILSGGEVPSDRTSPRVD